MTARIIAIDWSGAIARARQKIWLAEASEDGQIVRLEKGRDRTAVLEHLIQLATLEPALVVGIDFAFSLPAWFLADRQLSDAPALWDLVCAEGEQWLAGCERPFWGRRGRPRPDLPDHFRRTDREVRATGGIRPKSVFQISGAGAVGTGSIRGMPILRALRRAGFAVWPFDATRFPMVLEIYPRVLTGPIVKSSEDERRRYLGAKYYNPVPHIMADGVRSDDAFDALVSALVMATHASDFTKLGPATDTVERLEGQIWSPKECRSVACTGR